MIFISYSSKEYSQACNIKSVLENNGFSCWMAPESIPAGTDYAHVIYGAIRDCDIFVLVLSELSQRSQWCTKELDQALSFEKIVLPIHIDQSALSDAFNFRLTNVQRIEAYEELNKGIQKLIGRVQSLIGEKDKNQGEIGLDFYQEIEAEFDKHFANNQSKKAKESWIKKKLEEKKKNNSGEKKNEKHVKSLKIPECCEETEIIEKSFTIIDAVTGTTLAFLIQNLIVGDRAVLIHKPIQASSLAKEGSIERKFLFSGIKNVCEDIILVTIIKESPIKCFLNSAIWTDKGLYTSKEPTKLGISYLPTKDRDALMRRQIESNSTLELLMNAGMINYASNVDFSQYDKHETVHCSFDPRFMQYTIIDASTQQVIYPQITVGKDRLLYANFDITQEKKYIVLRTRKKDIEGNTDDKVTDYLLGCAYLRGTDGMKRDILKAADAFHNGIEKQIEVANCAYELGCMFKYLPEIQDIQEACHYLSMAADLKHDSARFEYAKLLIETREDVESREIACQFLLELIEAGYEKCGEELLTDYLDMTASTDD